MRSCEYSFPTLSCSVRVETPRYYIDFGNQIKPTYRCKAHVSSGIYTTFPTVEEAQQYQVTNELTGKDV